jgi:hypothetical protein
MITNYALREQDAASMCSAQAIMHMQSLNYLHFPTGTAIACTLLASR